MMKPLSRFFSLPDCTGRSCSHSNNGNRLSISWKIKFCTLIGFGLLWVQPLAAASKVQPPVDIPVETANRFGRLWIKSSDRIQPVDTYCSELLRKIYHRDHYGSLNANQMVLQWLCNPDFWKQVPLIYVKDRPLRDQFGEGEAHIAYTRFFDEQDTYLLVPEIEATFYRSLHVYNQHEKEVLKTDDKINLLMALFEGRMLPLFPTNENGVWISPGDNDARLFPIALHPIHELFDPFLDALRQQQFVKADSLIDRMACYQEAHIGDLGLSDSRKKAELLYNRADFFRTAFRGYLLLGAAFLLTFLLTRSSSPYRRPILILLTWGVMAMFLWQSTGMGYRWYISGRPPWTNAYESIIYVGWATVLGGLIFARRSPLTLMLATLMGGVILFVSNLNWLDPQITPLVPVLRSPWLMIHVSVITASYGFFGIGALCGIGILIDILREQPPRELRIVGELALIIGLALLTAGIFFGAIWANESWGRYWGWDPKETWALITMLYYAFVLHARHLPLFHNDYAFGALSLSGIYPILMTFFGVNYLLTGLHSYGYSEGIPAGILLALTLPVVGLILAAGLRFRRRRSTPHRP